MAGRSLRSKLILGGLLWMLVVLFLTHFVAIAFVAAHAGRQIRPVMHWVFLGLLALSLIAIGLSLIRKGLAPFSRLKESLAAVRDGRGRRLEGTYPTEVAPLVADMNALLDDREQRVARAVSRAGDLAHGLKTPLAVLAQEAEQAQAAGHHDLAARIGQQVERMKRQVAYHLAQARAASGAAGGARCEVAASVEGLVRTLLRLHASHGLAIEADVPQGLAVRVRREDLDELLGNLLENACQWARSRVAVSASGREGVVTILVDDDGPGLDPSMREAVLQRGVRADEASPGSGLGLAIVRDLAELYGGSITLGASPRGGLQARLLLPG